MNSEFGNKYLLPSNNYNEYNLKKNQKIKCRIDRINCNGKVFIEPECSIYKVGDMDTFMFYDSESRIKTKTFENYNVLKAKNKTTQRGIFFKKENYNEAMINENWLCEIVRIKKGEFYLKPIEKRD